MIRIGLAEDNSFLAEAIKDKLNLFPELKLKVHGTDGADLIRKLEDYNNLDLILMDIEMPNLNGIEATRLVRQKYPHIKVLMLTVFDDEENVFNAIMAGANGYLLKDEPADRLRGSIAEILNEGAPMSPIIAGKALKLLRSPHPTSPEPHNLTRREVEVLEHLSQGLDYHHIASNLNISPATVRKHIENIYSKLHVHNKVEAVQAGIRKRII